MGLGTLSTASDGTIIPATDHNQLKTALIQDIVPRDSTGAVADLGGKIGTATFRFSESHAAKLFFGLAASLLSMEDDGSGNALFKVAGSVIRTLKPKGFVQNIIASASSSTFTSSSASSTIAVSASITTKGNPVRVWLQSDGTNTPISQVITTLANTEVDIYRDSTLIGSFILTANQHYTPSSFLVLDYNNTTPGTYTYSFQVTSNGSAVVSVTQCQLMLEELL